MSEKQNQFKKYLLPLSLSIIFLVIGFGLGTLYQKNHLRSSFTNRSGNGQMMNENIGNRTGNRNNPNGSVSPNGTGQRNGNSEFTVGEITKIDDTSITLKTADGGSKIILISGDTTFNQSASATKDDLKVGSKVMVTGNTDTNTGSITGKTIQLNPATLPQPEAPQQ